MSTEEFKRIDTQIQWAFRGIVALGVAACAIVLTSLLTDVDYVKTDTNIIKNRLIKVETQLDNYSERSRERDEAVKEIQRTLEQIQVEQARTK